MATPMYPDFKVQVCENHEDAFIKDCIAVRIETLVPHEFWDEFKQRMGILDEIYEQGSRRPEPRIVPYADYPKELTSGG